MTLPSAPARAIARQLIEANWPTDQEMLEALEAKMCFCDGRRKKCNCDPEGLQIKWQRRRMGLPVAILALILPIAALAQSVPVAQEGLVLPNDIAKMTRDGLIRTGAGLLGDNNGEGLRPFAITDSNALGLCWNTAPTTPPTYRTLCTGHTAAGDALIDVAAVGTALKGLQVNPGAGMIVGTATGGAKGDGTINAQGLYINGVAIGAGGVGGAGITGRIALWTNSATLAATVPGTVATGTLGPELAVGTSADPGYPPGGAIPTTMYVMAQGARNALIGQVTVDVPFTVNPFLAVGTTGYGKLPVGTEAVAYGLYGLAELYNGTGVAVAGEVTARNFSGVHANDGVPPPVSQPNLTTANGWQVTCGIGIGHPVGFAKDCSTGIFVSNEAASEAYPSFANGLIIQAYRRFGMYIMSNSTGTQITAELDNNGNNFNLLLKTTGAMQASNAVLQVADSVGASHFNIFQNGDVHGNNFLWNGTTFLLPNLPTLGPSGGKYMCVNPSGILYASATTC